MSNLWRKLFCITNEPRSKRPSIDVEAKQRVEVSGGPPISVLKKPRIRSPNRAAISISDPGIAERGVRGLRGGGCGPSKVARPQQSPRNAHHSDRRRSQAPSSRTFVHTDGGQSRQSQLQATEHSAEDVMRAKLARKYPGYGTDQSATQAGANVLQPDGSACQFKGTGRYSRLMTDADAIELADRSGSVRGIRGGCSVQHDDDFNVQISRRVAISHVPRLAGRSINAGSTVATRCEDTVEASGPASESDPVSGEAQQQQRRLTDQRRGEGEGGGDEQRKSKEVLLRLKSVLCCSKPKASESIKPRSDPGEEPPAVPHNATRPDDIDTELQDFSTTAAVQGRPEAHEADESGTIIRRRPREASTELEEQQTDSDSTAVPIPDGISSAEQASTSSQDVDEIVPVDQARSTGIEAQSRFSVSSSSNDSDISAVLDDEILVEIQRQRVAEQDLMRREQLANQYDQRLLQLMEAHGDGRQSSNELSSDQRWNLRGGQDESEMNRPKMSCLAKVRRVLCCCGREDQNSKQARSQQLDDYRTEPQNRSQSTIAYRYRGTHLEGGEIGLALTKPGPRPATPSSMLGIAPQSRKVSHHLHTTEQSDHDVTPPRATIRRISEPAPTPSITWSRSVNERAQTRSATESMTSSPQQAKTEPTTPTKSEEQRPLSGTAQARHHRRAAAPLDGSENMLPLDNSVVQEAQQRQASRCPVPPRRHDESPSEERQHGVQRSDSSKRLRIHMTPQRPVSFTPFKSPGESAAPSTAFRNGPPSEGPKSSIFPEQSARL